MLELNSLDALPAVVEAVGGRAEVRVDGGVRRGTDVRKALALGTRPHPRLRGDDRAPYRSRRLLLFAPRRAGAVAALVVAGGVARVPVRVALGAVAASRVGLDPA